MFILAVMAEALAPYYEDDRCPGLAHSAYTLLSHMHLNHSKDLCSPQCEYRAVCDDPPQACGHLWTQWPSYTAWFIKESHQASTVTESKELALSPEASPIPGEKRCSWKQLLVTALPWQWGSLNPRYSGGKRVHHRCPAPCPSSGHVESQWGPQT